MYFWFLIRETLFGFLPAPPPAYAHGREAVGGAEAGPQPGAPGPGPGRAMWGGRGLVRGGAGGRDTRALHPHHPRPTPQAPVCSVLSVSGARAAAVVAWAWRVPAETTVCALRLNSQRSRILELRSRV